MEACDDEWIRTDEASENWDENVLGDSLRSGDKFKLRCLVDGIDVINAFDAIAVALMDGVDA